VVIPDWIWITFTFAFGCCVGSFLNVVIYRMPRDKSLVKPGSACPKCGKHIRFYDNIPLVSWLVLGGKCRYCKAPISARYFFVELLTGLMFSGIFYLFFRTPLRAGVPGFLDGGWIIYLVTIIMLAAFIAASAIDLELWVIPLYICWFVTAVGLIGSAVGAYVIEPAVIRYYLLLPSATATTGSLALGAAIGLGVSLLLVKTGLIKRSYEFEESNSEIVKESADEGSIFRGEEASEPKFNHRQEIFREILFLLPIILCSVAAYLILRGKLSACCIMQSCGLGSDIVRSWWIDLMQSSVISGLLGSLWGYFVGCGIVWATRILGTLSFGKEAMGLGDVHLYGAAGAVIGAFFVVVAFFIAPFFGLIWAGIQMFFKKSRQIPYGPFLSMGVLAVIILHDRIVNFVSILFMY